MHLENFVEDKKNIFYVIKWSIEHVKRRKNRMSIIHPRGENE
jgi:hypothetical protein